MEKKCGEIENERVVWRRVYSVEEIRTMLAGEDSLGTKTHLR